MGWWRSPELIQLLETDDPKPNLQCRHRQPKDWQKSTKPKRQDSREERCTYNGNPHPQTHDHYYRSLSAPTPTIHPPLPIISNPIREIKFGNNKLHIPSTDSSYTCLRRLTFPPPPPPSFSSDREDDDKGEKTQGSKTRDEQTRHTKKRLMGGLQEGNQQTNIQLSLQKQKNLKKSSKLRQQQSISYNLRDDTSILPSFCCCCCWL
jgi:hypothetical protein